MRYRSVEPAMVDAWKSVPIEQVEAVPDADEVIHTGLESAPAALHEHHLAGATHLLEVQEMHTRVLISAGELAEEHIASIAPERRLAWVIEDLHGSIRSRGVTIPLRGTRPGRVELTCGELHGHPALRLNLLDVEIERTIPLPEEADQVTARWAAGDLHIDW